MSKTETQSEALELAEFFGSMKKSSHRWYDGVPVHEKAAAELRRLDAENKALRPDAERYRWLRETHNDSCGAFAVAELGQGDWKVIEEVTETAEHDLDAAIDAAMAAAKNGGAA